MAPAVNQLDGPAPTKAFRTDPYEALLQFGFERALEPGAFPLFQEAIRTRVLRELRGPPLRLPLQVKVNFEKVPSFRERASQRARGALDDPIPDSISRQQSPLIFHAD